MFDAHEISRRAADLAEEAIAAAEAGEAAERLEGLILATIRQVVLAERERCATLAEERAAMWQRTKLNDPSWPAQGRQEAQERSKEAVAIADAIRAGVVLPPMV